MLTNVDGLGKRLDRGEAGKACVDQARRGAGIDAAKRKDGEVLGVGFGPGGKAAFANGLAGASAVGGKDRRDEQSLRAKGDGAADGAGGMGGGADPPMWEGAGERAGAMGAAFGQMHAIGAQSGGKAPVFADEEQMAMAAGAAAQFGADFGGVAGAKMPKDDA